MLMPTTSNDKILASVANVSIEAAHEALKRGLELQRAEYLSCLKQQRVLIERKLQKEWERRIASVKSSQKAAANVEVKIQELIKEIELLKQQVSNDDSTLQATANQLTEKLDQIKAEAGDGQPPDIEEQTPEKPITNSESENALDQTAATASDLELTPDKMPTGADSEQTPNNAGTNVASEEAPTKDATIPEPEKVSKTEDLPPVEKLDVNLADEGPLTVVAYHSEDESEHDAAEIQAQFRDRIKKFYTEYNPSKLQNIDRLIEKYQGREQELMLKLHQRYNVPFSRTNGAPPPPPVEEEGGSAQVEQQLPLTAKPRSKSFARGMFNVVKTVFSSKRKDVPAKNTVVSAGTTVIEKPVRIRSSSSSPTLGGKKPILRAQSMTSNLSRWLMGKREAGAESGPEPVLDEMRKLRLEVQKYQEQEACLKLEAQTLRDVVRERDSCHSAETDSLKEVVAAMHGEMKRICEENDRLKLQITEMQKNGDAEEDH